MGFSGDILIGVIGFSGDTLIGVIGFSGDTLIGDIGFSGDILNEDILICGIGFSGDISFSGDILNEDFMICGICGIFSGGGIGKLLKCRVTGGLFDIRCTLLVARWRIFAKKILQSRWFISR